MVTASCSYSLYDTFSLGLFHSPTSAYQLFVLNALLKQLIHFLFLDWILTDRAPQPIFSDMDSKTQKWPQIQSPKNFPRGSEGKESSQNAGGAKGGFDPWVRKISWRRKWEPTPGFLPGESHGQRSLMVCCPWCCRVGHD